MYDSSIGRFISRDPIDSGTNLYKYVDNNPANFTDPSGLKVVKFTTGSGTLWRRMPDDSDPKRYAAGLGPGAGPGSLPYYPATMTPEEKALVAFVQGDEKLERQLSDLLDLIQHISVHPNAGIFAGIAPDTLGSHCVRWQAALHEQIGRMPVGKLGVNFVGPRVFPLRFPRSGGPEHAISLVKIKRDGKEIIMGIDNGFLGGKTRLFDPEKAINDESLPPETRQDLQAALNHMKGNPPGR